ncbi:hypothetical protein ES703_44831 [subsurface metagenome]
MPPQRKVSEISKNEIEEAVAEFQGKFPRPDINVLKIDWHDLEKEWQSPWRNGNKPGAYIFLDSDECRLFIGKASSGRNLKTRLTGHFYANKNDKNSKQGKKALGTRYVGLLGLPPEHGFEAPAIEEYLITLLGPPRNEVIVGKARRKQKIRKFEKYEKRPEEAPY